MWKLNSFYIWYVRITLCISVAAWNFIWQHEIPCWCFSGLSFFILFSLLSFIVCLDLCQLDILECLRYFFLKMPIAIFMSSKGKRLQLPCEQGTLKFMRLKKIIILKILPTITFQCSLIKKQNLSVSLQPSEAVRIKTVEKNLGKIYQCSVKVSIWFFKWKAFPVSIYCLGRYSNLTKQTSLQLIVQTWSFIKLSLTIINLLKINAPELYALSVHTHKHPRRVHFDIGRHGVAYSNRWLWPH